MSYKYNPRSCLDCVYCSVCHWRITLGAFLKEARMCFSGKSCEATPKEDITEHFASECVLFDRG